MFHVFFSGNPLVAASCFVDCSPERSGDGQAVKSTQSQECLNHVLENNHRKDTLVSWRFPTALIIFLSVCLSVMSL